ncbi:Rieske (2Fe-2S) protein [bacterium]|nr:Rieske (2Fe-2S) protein [bacterium]
MDTTKVLKRPVFLRLFGLCATGQPKDKTSWRIGEGTVEVDLTRLPELQQPERAVRLEDNAAGIRVLLVKGPDGSFHAYRNECLHGKRRMDPVPGAETLQCCSVGHTTYDYDGNPLTNDLDGQLNVYTVEQRDDALTIKLD